MDARCGAVPSRFDCWEEREVTTAIVYGWGKNPPTSLGHIEAVLGGKIQMEAVVRCPSGHRMQITSEIPRTSLVRWDDGLRAAVVTK